MVARNYGANPDVVTTTGDRTLYEADKGRTFIATGKNRMIPVVFTMPTSFTGSFHARVGNDGDGRPVAVQVGTGIQWPRGNNLTEGANGNIYAISYDAGAYLDLLYDYTDDPNGRWRVMGGAGTWTSGMGQPAGSVANLGIDDPPSDNRIDFGSPSRASGVWQPVRGFTRTNTYSFTVPSTQRMYDLLRPGTPIRWIDATPSMGWSYGVVVTFVANGTVAEVGFTGAEMSNPPFGMLEAGPREAVHVEHVMIPGNFNDADDAALILHDNRTYKAWLSGDATLVMLAARCTDDDTGNAPYVTAAIAGSTVTLGANLEVSSASWTAQAVIGKGTIRTGYELEIGVDMTTPMSNGDAQNLSVEMVFVLDRHMTFWNHDEPSDPALQLVISGLPAPWAGLNNGIHAVLPDSYNITNWGGGTATRYRGEVWKFGSGTAMLWVRASAYQKHTTGTAWSTTWAVNQALLWAGSSMTPVARFTTNTGTGRVSNRVMRSFTLGPVTWTWWKLGDKWGSAFA